MRTLTPTRPMHILSVQGRARESNPGHDIHSVGCCHYTKLAMRFSAEEGGFEPSGPPGPARLANACDQAVFASLPNPRMKDEGGRMNRAGSASGIIHPSF